MAAPACVRTGNRVGNATRGKQQQQQRQATADYVPCSYRGDGHMLYARLASPRSIALTLSLSFYIYSETSLKMTPLNNRRFLGNQLQIFYKLNPLKSGQNVSATESVLAYTRRFRCTIKHIIIFYNIIILFSVLALATTATAASNTRDHRSQAAYIL